MVQVIFVQPDGTRITHSGQVGDTVMEVAVDNNVSGIYGQCGGGCTCCTCHCWVPDPYAAVLARPHPDEIELLDYAWGKTVQSRLSCQIKLVPALDGIHVWIPERQS
jgi:2Fe-2S ferredoxin